MTKSPKNGAETLEQSSLSHFRAKSLSDIESMLGLSSGGMQLTTNYQTGSTNRSVLLSEIQLNKEQLQRERFRRKVHSFCKSLLYYTTLHIIVNHLL